MYYSRVMRESDHVLYTTALEYDELDHIQW